MKGADAGVAISLPAGESNERTNERVNARQFFYATCWQSGHRVPLFRTLPRTWKNITSFWQPCTKRPRIHRVHIFVDRRTPNIVLVPFIPRPLFPTPSGTRPDWLLKVPGGRGRIGRCSQNDPCLTGYNLPCRLRPSVEAAVCRFRRLSLEKIAPRALPTVSIPARKLSREVGGRPWSVVAARPTDPPARAGFPLLLIPAASIYRVAGPPQNGSLEIAVLLEPFSLDVAATDRWGNTSIHLAAAACNYDLLKLLARRANLDLAEVSRRGLGLGIRPREQGCYCRGRRIFYCVDASYLILPDRVHNGMPSI